MSLFLIQANRCEVCGHIWVSEAVIAAAKKELVGIRDQVVLPLRCAKCKSPYWNKSGVWVGDAEKKREEHVPGFLEAGILAGEEFDRREEEAFADRSPDVGGTPRLRRLGKAEKPDLDVLRGICAGNISQAPQEQFTECVADLAFLKMCRSCEEPMQAIKGKWVCTVKGCGDEGRAQGSVE